MYIMENAILSESVFDIPNTCAPSRSKQRILSSVYIMENGKTSKSVFLRHLWVLAVPFLITFPSTYIMETGIRGKSHFNPLHPQNNKKFCKTKDPAKIGQVFL